MIFSRLIRLLPCWHDYETKQEVLVSCGLGTGVRYREEIVLCWKQCRKCAKSKLVHILK